MQIKDEHLAMSSGIGLAGTAIELFAKHGQDAISLFQRRNF
jgi:hypothetical protein